MFLGRSTGNGVLNQRDRPKSCTRVPFHDGGISPPGKDESPVKWSVYSIIWVTTEQKTCSGRPEPRPIDDDWFSAGSFRALKSRTRTQPRTIFAWSPVSAILGQAAFAHQIGKPVKPRPTWMPCMKKSGDLPKGCQIPRTSMRARQNVRYPAKPQVHLTLIFSSGSFHLTSES